MELPKRTIFFAVERAIKEYRRFAQKRLSEEVGDITVDQALVLLHIAKNPELTQSDIGELIFKDNSSVTRMIDLMISNGFLVRSMNPADRRRYKLLLTEKGEQMHHKIWDVVMENRQHALRGISKIDISHVNLILDRIIENCLYREK